MLKNGEKETSCKSSKYYKFDVKDQVWEEISEKEFEASKKYECFEEHFKKENILN